MMNQSFIVGEIVGIPPPTVRKTLIKLSPKADIKPLELLVSPVDEKTWILLRVSDISYVNPYQTADKIDIGQKTGVSAVPFKGYEVEYLPGVYQIAEADVVDCFTLQNGRATSLGKVKSPVPGKPVYTAGREVVEVLVGRPRHPLRLGRLAGTRDIDFVLDANALMLSLIHI